MNRIAALVHLHTVGRRLRAAERRWEAAPDPLPGQSILHGIPEELGSSVYEDYDRWLWDPRIDPETGLPLPGEFFKEEELADLADARARADAATRFKRRAERAAKVPLYSLFIPLPAGDAARREDAQAITQSTDRRPGAPPPPPPPAAPGGRALPSPCLTARLLAQRPQPASARRAG